MNNANYRELAAKSRSAAASSVKGFLKWLVIAVISGCIIGAVGAVFHLSLDRAAEIRSENTWMIFFLPLAGILTVWLYHVSKMDSDKGTNQIILGAQGKESVSLKTAPLILATTLLTHLFGGSAGREGAALQLGGSLISPLKRLLRLNGSDYSILIMCGMAAGFSSMFGTPAAAAVFAIEVTVVGYTQYSAIVPCLISSITASLVARFMGCEPTGFAVSGVPEFSEKNIFPVIAVLLLAAGGAAAALLFCRVLRLSKQLYSKYIPNIYIRAAVGGALVVVLTLAVRTYDYNGAGTDVIQRAFGGNVFWGAFLLKILFTSVTLGAGYRGGEIVPTLFIGSTLGCWLGALIGLDPSFGAAIGAAAVFCGVTNCPLATILLCVEMFGGNGLVFYALASGVSYMLSGYDGLYSAQKFVGSKLAARRFDYEMSRSAIRGTENSSKTADRLDIRKED